MNETLKTIHSLRSIHFGFSSREIKDEDLETILDASVRAANASNRQSYSIVVVDDKDIVKNLAQMNCTKALIFCMDFNRIIDTAKHLGHQYSADGSDYMFVSGSTDTILAAQTAAIAAKSLGIDSLFSSGIHRGDIDRVYKLLDLPEKSCFPSIMLLLGYPKEEPEFKKRRVRGPGIIHYNKYHRATTDELETLVQQYDEPGAGIYPLWQEKGHKHYLDWFHTKWAVPRKDSEHNGTTKDNKSQLAEILERTGVLE